MSCFPKHDISSHFLDLDMCRYFSLLSVMEKTEAILGSCASSPAESNSVYYMYRQRCNMLRSFVYFTLTYPYISMRTHTG